MHFRFKHLVHARRFFAHLTCSLPFLSALQNIGMSHTYPSLASVKSSLLMVGKAIQEEGIPKDFGPMTFVFTGDGGNVATGAIEIFNNLPVEWIGVKELQEIAEGKGTEPPEIFCWFYLSSLKYNAAFMTSASY